MAVISLGWWALDTQKGQVSRKKSNKKKGLLEFETKTSTQRKSRRTAKKSSRTAADQARRKTKFEQQKSKAQQRQAFKERQEARAEQSQPTVTVTGVWGNGKSRRPGPGKVVQGEVVEARTAPKAVGSGQGVSRMCGGKTREGYQCLRMVAPGSQCPYHSSPSSRRPTAGASR